MIIVTGIVGLELVIMMAGTAIPESRITARPVLIDKLRQNVRSQIMYKRTQHQSGPTPIYDIISRRYELLNFSFFLF